MSNLCDNSDETMCDLDAPLVLILRTNIREKQIYLFTHTIALQQDKILFKT